MGGGSKLKVQGTDSYLVNEYRYMYVHAYDVESGAYYILVHGDI